MSVSLKITQSFGKMPKIGNLLKTVKNKKVNTNITQFTGPKTTSQSSAEQRIKIGNTKKNILKTKMKSLIKSK